MVDLEAGLTPRAPRLAVWELIRDSVSTFGRAPWTLVGVSLLPSLTGLVPDAARIAIGRHNQLAELIWIVGTFVQVFVGVLVQGAVTAGASRLVSGERFGLRSAFAAGIRRGAPLCLVGLFAFLTIALGLICLIVPGIVAAVGLSVAAPACVIEDLSPVASLKRSWALTGGHRWRIIGLSVALILLALAVVALGVIVVTGLAYGLATLHVGKSVAAPLAIVAFLPVLAAVIGVASVVPVVLFHRLGGGAAAGPWSGTGQGGSTRNSSVTT